MPYRDYVIEIPPKPITLRTRVSDEATASWFLDWLDHRGTNGTHGRPPDIDTEFHRIWIGDADEPDDEHSPSLLAYERPLATLTQTIEFPGELVSRTVKILMGFNREGTLMVRVRAQRHPGGESWFNGGMDYAPDEMDKADTSLQETLESLTELASAMGAESNWMLALPSYFESLEAEDEVARADRKAEVEANGPLHELKWSRRFEQLRTTKLAGERSFAN